MGSLSAETTPSPHVIMFPGPMHSHCVPYMQLARKLCALGIDITFINTEHSITQLKATKEDTLGVEGGRLRLVALPNGEGYKPSDSPLSLMSTLEERAFGHFEKCLKSMVEGGSPATVPNSQGWATPCCAIVDSFVAWARKILDRFKGDYTIDFPVKYIKSYFYWTSTAASLALMMHTPVLHAQGIIPVDPTKSHELKPVSIPCIPPLHPLDFIGGLQRRHHVMHPLLLQCAHQYVEVSGILVNSSYELEASVFHALHEHYNVGAPTSKLQSIIAIGPTLPASVFTKEDCDDTNASVAGEDKDPIVQWLDNQPPSSVIYISFGSIATLSCAQLVELALGLEASEQRFVWVVRPPSDPAMVAAGSEVYMVLPPGFLDRTKERGIIVTGWAPQLQILQHTATGGFLTHCGWNSILESICASVPMLTWPIQAEQMMNSRWLVEVAEVALRVPKDFDNFVTRDKVEEAVRLLMCKEEGRAVKRKVSDLKVTLQMASDETGSSARNLKSFVENLHQLNEKLIAS